MELTVIVIISVLFSLMIIAKILSSAGKKKKTKSYKGKRCPGCKTIIMAKNKVCRHCGYEFD